jgi:hypothetical protein
MRGAGREIYDMIRVEKSGGGMERVRNRGRGRKRLCLWRRLWKRRKEDG